MGRAREDCGGVTAFLPRMRMRWSVPWMEWGTGVMCELRSREHDCPLASDSGYEAAGFCVHGLTRRPGRMGSSATIALRWSVPRVDCDAVECDAVVACEGRSCGHVCFLVGHYLRNFVSMSITSNAAKAVCLSGSFIPRRASPPFVSRVQIHSRFFVEQLRESTCSSLLDSLAWWSDGMGYSVTICMAKGLHLWMLSLVHLSGQPRFDEHCLDHRQRALQMA